MLTNVVMVRSASRKRTLIPDLKSHKTHVDKHNSASLTNVKSVTDCN